MGFGYNQPRSSPRIHRISKIPGCQKDPDKHRSCKGISDFGGGTGLIRQRGYRIRTSRKRKRRILFDLLYCTKETRRSPSNSQLTPVEPIYSKAAFQNGITTLSETSAQTRGLDEYSRPERCVHARTYPHISQEVPPIQCGGEILSVQSPTFRPVIGPKGVYESAGTGYCQSQNGGCACFSVPGRHFEQISVSIPRGSDVKKTDTFSRQGGFPHQHSQVIFDSSQEKAVYRGDVRYLGIQSISARGQNEYVDSVCNRIQIAPDGASKTVLETPRYDGSLHRGGINGQIVHETHSIVSDGFLETQLQGTGAECGYKRRFETPLNMVAESSKSVPRGPTGSSETRYCLNDGLQLVRMGWACPEQICAGDLEGSRVTMAHQYAGTGGGAEIMHPVRECSPKQMCISPVRQYNSGFIYKPHGGNEIPKPMHEGVATVAMGYKSQCMVDSSPLTGRGKLLSGQAVERNVEGVGMGSQQSGLQKDFSETGEASNRSICNSREQTNTGVLFQVLSPGSVPGECIEYELEESVGICISANKPPSHSVRQGRVRPMCPNSDNTIVAEKVLVSKVTGLDDRDTNSIANHTRLVESVGGGEGVSSRSRQTPIIGLESERRHLIEEGFSPEVVDTIQGDIRQSTKEVYSRRWSVFANWCAERSVDPCTASISQICAFLQNQFNKGVAYGSLAVFRSAISKFHKGLNGKPVGQNMQICRFLKGAFNAKPPVKSLLPSWDLAVVLEGLRKPPFAPSKSISMKCLTWKTAFLIAITSGRRCSEMQALGRKSPYIRFEAGGVRLRTVPGFLPKTATPIHLGQDIVVPEYSEKELCPRRTIKIYIKRTTEVVSNSENHLFVTFGGQEKGRQVSKRTISGWLVKVIKETHDSQGKLVGNVRAHSTRAMTASWAMFNRASFIDVLKAADWRTGSTFARHYKLDLWRNREGLVGKAVLQASEKP